MAGFTFPPPPPPPPPAAASSSSWSVNNSQTPYQHQDGFRGGRGNQGGRGRGRGNPSRGGFARGGHQGHTSMNGRSDGGARLNAQTPMTGANHGHHGFPLQQQAQHNSYPYPQHRNGTAEFHAQSSSPQSSYALMWNAVHVQAEASSMGPPLRMGFDHSNQGVLGGGFAGMDMSANGSKRKREHYNQGPPIGHGRAHDGRPGHQPHINKPKVQVAPAVPSFGFALPQAPDLTLPSKPLAAGETNEKRRNKKKRKTNQLGLTPKGEQHESSDEDIDEEAAYAGSAPGL